MCEKHLVERDPSTYICRLWNDASKKKKKEEEDANSTFYTTMNSMLSGPFSLHSWQYDCNWFRSE